MRTNPALRGFPIQQLVAVCPDIERHLTEIISIVVVASMDRSDRGALDFGEQLAYRNVEGLEVVASTDWENVEAPTYVDVRDVFADAVANGVVELTLQERGDGLPEGWDESKVNLKMLLDRAPDVASDILEGIRNEVQIHFEEASVDDWAEVIYMHTNLDTRDALVDLNWDETDFDEDGHIE